MLPAADAGSGAGKPPPPPAASPAARALVRALWVAYMVLIVAQAVSGASGFPFLNAAMFFAGVFTAALFGVWAAESGGELAVVALQEST